MSTQFVETHAHLDSGKFNHDRDIVIRCAVDAGVAQMITVGADLSSSEAAVALAEQYPSVYATVGIHPHGAESVKLATFKTLRDLATHPKVVAIGEIGLDFYRSYSSHEEQIKMFLRQLEIADALDLPVIIHDREAHSDVLKILKKIGKGERRGVIHCFSGDMDLAMALINLGYFISIPGTVTYKKAAQIKEVAARLPLECMLVETDAPFLAPIPKRGKRNEPLFVTFTAQEIVRLRGIEFDKVALQTSKNAKILFGLP